MDKAHLILLQGGRGNEAAPHRHDTIERAVSGAIQAGYRIGQPVRIGHVDGKVVGYNIGDFGRYRGTRYPLLVKTEFGVAKFGLAEVAAA